MPRVFTLTSLMVHVEEDNYHEGCLPKTGFIRQSEDCNRRFPTIADAIKALSREMIVNDNPGNWQLYIDGDDCRLEYNQLEDEHGNPVMKGDGNWWNESDRQAWMDGKKKMYLADYSWIIKAEMIEASPITADDAKAAGILVA